MIMKASSQAVLDSIDSMNELNMAAPVTTNTATIAAPKNQDDSAYAKAMLQTGETSLSRIVEVRPQKNRMRPTTA